ncbi:MAG: TMEM175 family protein [Chitinophagaceae bacterium]
MSNKFDTTGDKHPKQEFQVERIAFFSDAVFAIAITLLIIEFRPPHVTKESTYEEIWSEVLHMKFKLGALLVSFALIVNYWIKHHTLFKHIHNYNPAIVKSNMWLLLPVIFFPFTTSFLYESLESNEEVLKIPYRLFILNNVLASAATCYLYYLATKKYKHCSYELNVEEKWTYERELLVMAVSFLIVFLLSFISIQFSVVGLIPFLLLKGYHKFFKTN